MSLLWADGYAIGDGTAQNLWHSVGNLGRVEVQPGTLGVLFQQAQAFEAAAYAQANQLNQLLQLASVRRLDALKCLDALKSGWSVVAIYIDAIQE